MAQITAALDEGGANTLFNTALATVPLPPATIASNVCGWPIGLGELLLVASTN